MLASKAGYGFVMPEDEAVSFRRAGKQVLNGEAIVSLEAAGDHLYANRVRVYPKTVHGVVRQTKWAILIVCLTIYYLLPWVRWHRGPGEPSQALLLDISNERFYFFNLELWPQDIWLLAGLLILGIGASLPIWAKNAAKL